MGAAVAGIPGTHQVDVDRFVGVSAGQGAAHVVAEGLLAILERSLQQRGLVDARAGAGFRLGRRECGLRDLRGLPRLELNDGSKRAGSGFGLWDIPDLMCAVIGKREGSSVLTKPTTRTAWVWERFMLRNRGLGEGGHSRFRGWKEGFALSCQPWREPWVQELGEPAWFCA